MSVEEALREAVRAELAEMLPPLLRAAMHDAVASLRVGDAGDELLDTESAAKLLGTTAQALRRSAERGRAPVEPIKVGRRLKWRRADLLALSARAPR